MVAQDHLHHQQCLSIQEVTSTGCLCATTRAYRRSNCCRARAAAGGRYRNNPSAARRRLAEVYTDTVTRTDSSEIGRPASKGEGEQEAKGRVNFLMLIDSNKSGQEIPAQPYTWIRC